MNASAPSDPIAREETIFNAAVELRDPVKRATYLELACDGDPALRARLEKMLAADRDSFFEKPIPSPLVAADPLLAPSASPVAEPMALSDRIGRYKLLQKIGEGGCGVVYLAEQDEPVRRRIALKVIKLGMDTKSVIARFEAERQALALMDHPNIAKVLDAGATDTGRPFFVMELVRGVRITDYCDQNNLPTRDRLALFTQVCHAIQHAHQKGIIHRDIKPSNILVTLHDGVPVPKVIDFGIAKATTDQRLTDRTLFTALQQFIGTPAYMSPEQAEMSGLDIDTRSDIYSLGVLLYELLTGKTPFDGQKMMASGIDAMRKTIREEEPVRPSTKLSQTLVGEDVKRLTSKSAIDRVSSRRLLQIRETISLLRGDLDWIVMKCLEKDRSRRYDTANGLAADLNRHLHNEPIIARPPTPLYRFRKMVRRNKLTFAAASAVLVVLIVGLFVASWLAVRATKAEQAERVAKQAEQKQTAQARAGRDRALVAEAKARHASYTAEINVAFHALAENNLGQARSLLDRQRPTNGVEGLRGFEWRYLWRLCQGDEFATFTDEGARAAAFSPDGKLFVYSGAKIIVREATSLKLVTTLPVPADTLSFAPHTNLLASGHGSGVELWNTKTWQLLRSLPDTMEPSLFSPDGRWLLTGVAKAFRFRLWDTQTWQPVGDCAGAPQLAFNARNAVAFSPDNQFLVTVAGQNEIGGFLRVWHLPSLEEVLPELRFGPRGRPGSVAFSTDGKHLITGLWDGRLVIQEFATRKPVVTLKEHTAWVTMVAVAREGKTILTSSSDRTVNVWDATTFEHLVRLRGHVRGVMTLAVSPDGSTIVSGGADRTTKLWHSGTRHTDPTLEGAGLVAGFTRVGHHLVAATSNSWCVWTPENGARMDFPTPTSPTVITSGRPSGKPYDLKPDEPLSALGRTDGAIEIWHMTTGEKVSTWPAHSDGIGAVNFSPDGKQLATGSIKGEVKIWDFATQRQVGRFGPVDCELFCLAFSPDGKTLAASGRSSSVSVWLWDLSTRGTHRKLPGHAIIVASVAFSPDGRLLATPSLVGNEVRLWELDSGINTITLYGHVGGVTAAVFSPDGKTLATAGTDMKVKLWNIATQQELATIPVIVEFPTLSFSPDGRMLAVGEMTGDNRRIQILHAPSFAEIAAMEAKPDQTEGPAR